MWKNKKELLKRLIVLNSLILKNKLKKFNTCIKLTYINIEAFFKKYKLDKEEELDIYSCVPRQVIIENKVEELMYDYMCTKEENRLQKEYNYQKNAFDYMTKKDLYLKKKQKRLIKTLKRKSS